MPIKPRTLTNEEISKNKKRSMGRTLLNIKTMVPLLIIIIIPLTLYFTMAIYTYFGPFIALIFLGVSVWFIFNKSKKMMANSSDSHIRSYNSAAEDVASTLGNLLTRVDYYNTYFFGGIAADISARQIAIVTLDAFETNSITKTVFDIKNIKDYKLQEYDATNAKATTEYLRVTATNIHDSYDVTALGIKHIFECKKKMACHFISMI